MVTSGTGLGMVLAIVGVKWFGVGVGVGHSWGNVGLRWYK